MARSLSIAFGEAIKVVRGDRGISQEELGRRSGLHRAHIGEIERGEISPTLDSVQLIAVALDIAPSKLIVVAESQVTKRSHDQETGLGEPTP